MRGQEEKMADTDVITLEVEELESREAPAAALADLSFVRHVDKASPVVFNFYFILNKRRTSFTPIYVLLLLDITSPRYEVPDGVHAFLVPREIPPRIRG